MHLILLHSHAQKNLGKLINISASALLEKALKRVILHDKMWLLCPGTSKLGGRLGFPEVTGERPAVHVSPWIGIFYSNISNHIVWSSSAASPSQSGFFSSSYNESTE